MALSTTALPTVDFQVSDWSDLDPHFTTVCSEATLQSDRRGFFLDIAEQVTDQAGSDFLDMFARLSSDGERISTCYSHPKVRDYVRSTLHNVQPLFRPKSAEVAAQRRVEGERTLRGGNARAAVTTLSQAVMRSERDQQLALALWARSQALMQLRFFDLAITDVLLSIKSGLSEDLQHEAFHRLALCQHAQGDKQKASGSLQVAARLVQKLQDPGTRASWTATLQQAMGALRVPRAIEVATPAGAPQTAKGPAPALAGGPHPDMSSASSLLREVCTPGEGRHMVAAGPVRTGDTLVAEAPEAACLLPDKFGTHCLHCFSRLVAPVACEQCSGVAFCGPACRAAASAYHRYECRHLGLLLGSGMSVLCHLALRLATQRGLAFLRDLQPHAAGRTPAAPATPQQASYLKVFGLETHSNKRSAKDFVHRSIMALFLLRILQQSDFFPQVSRDDDDLNADELLVAAVLLRHLQLLQFNAHEVYETMILPKPDQQLSKFRSARVSYIGVAVYPTVALFNHECYPAVTRYFRGRDLVLSATRPLSEGEVVSENYGPIFTKRGLPQRQRTLGSRYWFRCACEACQEDWPLLEHLNDRIIKFRCPTTGCPQLLSAPHAADSLQSAPCPRCQQPVHLADLRARAEGCGRDLDAALEAMERDEPEEAVPLLCRYLDDMHRLTRPPLRSVHLAQEALRTCLADTGNVWAPPDPAGPLRPLPIRISDSL